MADIGIYGKLVNRTPDNILVGAEQVFDGNYGTDGSDQQTINAQLAAALATIASLQQRITTLEGGISTGGGGTGGSIVNLNASDRTTTYSLATAIATLTSPPYGAILMYVDTSNQWSIWQFTGTDYTNADDWSPMGVTLSTNQVYLDQEGNSITDIELSAADRTAWSIS